MFFGVLFFSFRYDICLGLTSQHEFYFNHKPEDEVVNADNIAR